VCQTCLLDLEYGLPVQVRDTALVNPESIPVSDVNREWFAEQAERRIEAGQLPYGKVCIFFFFFRCYMRLFYMKYITIDVSNNPLVVPLIASNERRTIHLSHLLNFISSFFFFYFTGSLGIASSLQAGAHDTVL
jgi:hypothetical protein